MISLARRFGQNKQCVTLVEFAIVFSMIAVAGVFSLRAASGKFSWAIVTFGLS